MNEARKMFEAIMRGKGYGDADFVLNKNGKYVANTVQVRWSHFLMGWEMALASKS